MFSMDFNEVKGLGFSGSIFHDAHDPSFWWKKSVFFFGSTIVCLGTNICHGDGENPAVTTLFQNATCPKSFIVNGEKYEQTEKIEEIPLKEPNWLIDTFGVGYFLMPCGGSLKYKRAKQQTPSANQVKPTVLNGPA